MRAIQKVIICIYCLLVVTACIYVPWASLGYTAWYDAPKIQYDALPLYQRYSPFWKPALKITVPLSSNISTYSSLKGQMGEYIFNRIIDYRQILLEIIAITAVFAILFVLTLRPKKVLPGL